MPITDILPWKRDKEHQMEIRRGRAEDSVLALRDEIDRLFDDFFSRPFGLLERPFRLSPFMEEGFRSLGDFSPRVDLSESDKAIKITAELPGMEAEDIGIELHGDYLTIRGEKKSESEQKDERFHRVERSYGSFYRTIPLPSEVDPDKVEAKFKKGVLRITMPKTSTSPSSKHIEVKQG